MASNETHYNNLPCLSTYSGRVYMTNYQRYILVATDVIVMILNFAANSSVIIVLVMRKFIRNTSLILLFFLSISDTCLALITQTLFAILIGKYSEKSYCTFEMIVQFFAILLTHTSVYNSLYWIRSICTHAFLKQVFLSGYKEKSFSSLICYLFIFFFSNNVVCAWNQI